MRVLLAVIGAIAGSSLGLANTIVDRDAHVETRATTTSPLVNFQVQAPPALSKSVKTCTVQLVQHLFANSYYAR